MCLAAGLPSASGFVHDPPVSDPTPTSLKEPGEPDPADSSSESRLLAEAQQGSSRAAGALFERYRSWLRKRMRGRLPPWARGSLDTSDLVQDALHHTFVRLNEFKSNRASALRVYFRRSVENRIRDEMRRATRRRHVIAPEQPLRASEDGAPQLRQLMERPSLAAVRGRPEMPEAPGAAAHRWPRRARIHLPAARPRRTPAECGRGAHGPEEGVGSAQRRHPQFVAKIRPARSAPASRTSRVYRRALIRAERDPVGDAVAGADRRKPRHAGWMTANATTWSPK